MTRPGSVVGETIITKIRKIGLTGETGTGMHVMEAAATELKHITYWKLSLSEFAPSGLAIALLEQA